MKHVLKISILVLIQLSILLLTETCNRKEIPSVETYYVTKITRSNAICGGNVTHEGGSPVTERGICWDKIRNPVITSCRSRDGSGPGIFTSTITGLEQNTRYYARAYAINSEGIGYGNEISFNTLPVFTPRLSTDEVQLVTTDSAVCSSTVINDGGGEIISRGVCWSTSAGPTLSDNKTIDGQGSGTFNSTLSDIKPNTPYYARAYASNISGTGYGNEITFTLWINIPGPVVSDIEGNTYKTVKIGSQVWMAENLRTLTYSNGIKIPVVADSSSWLLYHDLGACCWYESNESEFGNTYGALYNWRTVETGFLCPAGWHVPASLEWNNLIDYLGGELIAGGKLKESGNEHWLSPNTEATNESGFNALPGGQRYFPFNFSEIGEYCFWWTSTGAPGFRIRYKMLSYKSGAAYKDGIVIDPLIGFSVRCLKD